MKISLLAILLSSTLLSKEINIISVEYPPYMEAAREDQGMAPRFIHAAMEGSGVDIKIQFYPVKRAFKKFLESESLILATMRVIPPGEYKMLPITKVKSNIFGMKDKKVLKKIAYERGLYKIKKLLKGKGYIPTEMVNYPAGIKMLLADRIDGIQAVELTMRHFISKEVDQRKNYIVTRKQPSYEDHAGLIVKKEHAHLLEPLIAGFKRLQRRGEDHKILKPELEKFAKDDTEFYLLDDYSIIEN
tara:strand:+ start:165 stop:899 length:735 start_codon:yes stop_codon:yes gene_type:complete